MKLAEAFEKNHVQEYNQQLKKLQQIEKEESDKLARGTLTQQSTSAQHENNPPSSTRQATDIVEFYQKLILNNLSLTNIQADDHKLS